MAAAAELGYHPAIVPAECDGGTPAAAPSRCTSPTARTPNASPRPCRRYGYRSGGHYALRKTMMSRNKQTADGAAGIQHSARTVDMPAPTSGRARSMH